MDGNAYQNNETVSKSLFYRFWRLCGESDSSPSDWCECNNVAAVCQCIMRPDGPSFSSCKLDEQNGIRQRENSMNKKLELWNLLINDKLFCSQREWWTELSIDIMGLMSMNWLEQRAFRSGVIIHYLTFASIQYSNWKLIPHFIGNCMKVKINGLS